jgi:hypothetical protein
LGGSLLLGAADDIATTDKKQIEKAILFDPANPVNLVNPVYKIFVIYGIDRIRSET